MFKLGVVIISNLLCTIVNFGLVEFMHVRWKVHHFTSGMASNIPNAA
jgi:hypothetical protein